MKEKIIKLICSDIDGTLLNKDRELSQKTLASFHRLNTTHPVILISSRMPKSMRLLQKELGVEQLPLIAYNGSLILKDTQSFFSQEIDIQLIKEITSYITSTQIHLSLYHNDEWVVPQNDSWAQRETHNTRVRPLIQPLEKTIEDWEKRSIGAHKIMCMGDAHEINLLFKQLEDKHGKQINAYRSKDTYVEISHIKQDKASALSFLLNHHYPEISLEHCIAFGDNYNDATLLRQVGIGVAVANAKAEILSLADFITDKNTEDGVANYLDKVLP